MNHPHFRTAIGLVGAACLILAAILLASPPPARSSPHTGEYTPAYLPIVLRLWPLSTATLPPTPSTGRLLISEVLYDSTAAEPAGEWLELYNAGGTAIDLSSYKLGDAANPGDHEGMMQFPPGAAIASGQILVVANQAAAFFTAYGFLPDFELAESDPAVPNLIEIYSYNVELTNGGDELLVLDGGDTLVDALSWGSSRVYLDPPAPVVAAGHSLERCPASVDSDAAQDWRNQPAPAPGHVDLTPPTPLPTATPTVTATPTQSLTPTGGPSPTPTVTPTPFGGRLLISEVLYNAVAEPGGEWIELYNADTSTIGLADFKVGDAQFPGANEGMYRFPASATIAPGQAIVVASQASAFFQAHGFEPDYELVETDSGVPNLTKHTAWASGSVALTNSGDEVLLLDGGDQVVDGLSWGSSTWAFDPSAPAVGDGHSLERYPPGEDTDTAADWRDQPAPDPREVDLTPPTPTPTPTATGTHTPTPTASLTPTIIPTPTPSPTPVSYLLVSEVFYDTPGTDADEEWVEIYNPTANTFDLSGYKIGDEETQGDSEGMFQFPAGASIAPAEKVIIALKATGYFALYGFNPDYEVIDTDPTVPNMSQYAAWASGVTIAMANTGDEVLLLDGTDSAVDVVTYEGGIYPGVIPHPGVVTGHSIERFPPHVDTNDCSVDFVDRSPPTPGTSRQALAGHCATCPGQPGVSKRPNPHRVTSR